MFTKTVTRALSCLGLDQPGGASACSDAATEGRCLIPVSRVDLRTEVGRVSDPRFRPGRSDPADLAERAFVHQSLRPSLRCPPRLPHLGPSGWGSHRHQRQGPPDFEALQARLRPRNGKLPGHLCYMVFDCLYMNGHSLLNRPLEDRQAVLWELQHALQTDAVKLT